MSITKNNFSGSLGRSTLKNSAPKGTSPSIQHSFIMLPGMRCLLWLLVAQQCPETPFDILTDSTTPTAYSKQDLRIVILVSLFRFRKRYSQQQIVGGNLPLPWQLKSMFNFTSVTETKRDKRGGSSSRKIGGQSLIRDIGGKLEISM
ncbi:hypothetical protein WN943_005258 [Citrus x changshan-huyou]